MSFTPSREWLKELVCLICEQQDKMVSTLGMTRDLNRSFAAEQAPLKTPIYFLREFFGKCDIPNNRAQRHRHSSFWTSPPDYLSECIMQIKNGDLPIVDLNLRHSLINFYSELTEAYES